MQSSASIATLASGAIAGGHTARATQRAAARERDAAALSSPPAKAGQARRGREGSVTTDNTRSIHFSAPRLFAPLCELRNG